MVKKKFFRAVIIVFVLIIAAFVILFCFRNSLLHYAIKKYQDKFRDSYHTTLTVQESHFIDINSIQLSNLVMVPDQRDTLLKVHSVVAGVNLFKAVFGTIKLMQLDVQDVNLNIVEKDSINNYSVFFRKKTKGAASVNKSGYAEMANKLINSFFDKIPSAVEVKNLQLSINRNKEQFFIDVPQFSVKDDKLSAHVIDYSTSVKKTWGIEGSIEASDAKFNVVIYSKNSTGMEIPFLYSRYKLKVSCDTLNIALRNMDYSGGELKLVGEARVNNLFINHAKISPNYVIIKKAGINYNTTLGENWLALDSSSTILMNKVTFQPYVKFIKVSPEEKEINFHIKTPKIASQDFFESLPLGMCENLFGIQSEGFLTYKLDFDINTKKPDSLHFESTLAKENFKIIKYGATYFPKINESFSHTVYERGQAVRTFMVGPENPNYTPYEEISDYLKYSLLTSEDGSFFYHKGFNEEAFAKSIATNFKKGFFAKGGSTISMQLVKNLFLTRNKTISRKLEEAMIVWLIENNHLVSKQRMYEVYLNIIEWGPNIYGIKEAASFYFDKRPSELTLQESIYLASIVPRPKYFKYSFDETGNLREYLAGYYKLVANRLLRKEIITEEEFNALQPSVTLRGPALKLVTPTDSVPDFIQNEEEIIQEP